MAHTPGPWRRYTEDLRGGTYWCVKRGEMADSIDIHVDDNGEADTALIAAAPDLLAALKECSERIEYAGIFAPSAIQKARAAITRAEGTKP